MLKSMFIQIQGFTLLISHTQRKIRLRDSAISLVDTWLPGSLSRLLHPQSLSFSLSPNALGKTISARSLRTCARSWKIKIKKKQKKDVCYINTTWAFYHQDLSPDMPVEFDYLLLEKSLGSACISIRTRATIDKRRIFLKKSINSIVLWSFFLWRIWISDKKVEYITLK